MFKESGNLLKEKLEISKEFLDHCNRNGIRIDLKTGDYSVTAKPQRGKAFIKDLVTQIHQLYLSGNLHPYDYFGVLCCKNSNKVIEMFQRADLRILSKEEKQEIYGNRDEEIKKEALERMRQTNLERYGSEQIFESAEVKEKIKQTMLERYGVDSALKSQEIRDKGTQTMLDRYGVDHSFKMDKAKEARKKTCQEKYGASTPLESKEIQEKIEATNLERYGVRRPLQNPKIFEKTVKACIQNHGVWVSGIPKISKIRLPEIQEKIEATNLERFGVRYPFQSRDIQQKIQEGNLIKFGVNYPLESKEIRDKGNQTIQDKHGVSSALMLPWVRERSVSPEANTKRKETRKSRDERFKAVEDFKNREISETEVIEQVSNYATCHQLKILKDLGIKEPTNFSTELKVKAFLESLGVKFIQNARKAHGVKKNPKSKHYYDADFLISDLNLVIEVNGLAFHSVNRSANGNRKTRDYHFNKFKAFHNAGYRMISFTDYELKHMWSSVTEIIKFHLSLVTELSDSTKVEYQEFLGYPIEESLNYGFFNKNNPNSVNFENFRLPEEFIVPRMIDGWEYWDCGRVLN